MLTVSARDIGADRGLHGDRVPPNWIDSNSGTIGVSTGFCRGQRGLANRSAVRLLLVAVSVPSSRHSESAEKNMFLDSRAILISGGKSKHK